MNFKCIKNVHGLKEFLTSIPDEHVPIPTMVMIIITTTAFKKLRMYILGTIKKKTNSCSLLKVDDYEGMMNAD